MNPASGATFNALNPTTVSCLGCPFAVAENVIDAADAPCGRALQFTVNVTLTSGLRGEIEPRVGLILSQDAFELTVKVKALGPPAPTST